MILFKHILIIFSFILGSLIFAQGQEQAQQQDKSKETTTSDAESAEVQGTAQIESKWYDPDYRPYISSFDDLSKLSDAFSRNKLRQALANYQTGKSIIQKMRDEVRRLGEDSDELRHLDEKWYWQTMDRKSREERVMDKVKLDAKLKSVTYFTRAIYNLDEVKSQKIIESDEYKKLLSAIYVDWVVNQYDLGNITQCIDILERYIALDISFEKEAPAHKYLASSYGFKEKVLVKYNAGTEQERVFYKKKKNEHLLRAAELRYKKDSPEYAQIVDLVNRDEIIAVAP